MTENFLLTSRDQIHSQGRLVINYMLYIEKLLKIFFSISGPWWFGCPKTKFLFDDGENSVDILTNLQFDYSEAEDKQDYINFGAGDEDLDVDTNY